MTQMYLFLHCCYNYQILIVKQLSCYANLSIQSIAAYSSSSVYFLDSIQLSKNIDAYGEGL